ncbi:sensor histidine kinase [uncultured Polaribacter sp.]|uniref:sensor histidine kinase n=1 Tax=uncultured Polaribacter sp. TaxID=174711 RepID=UPI0026224B04|nr:sensor histidine kinase [uncultured Polaribacter sp.]
MTKNSIILIIIFFTIIYSSSSQIIVKNPIISLHEFKYSLQLYNKLKKSDFKLDNNFKNFNEAIAYFETSIYWANKNGTQLQIIKAKQTVLGIYIHQENNAEIIARSKNILKYEEVYEIEDIVTIYYDLKQAYKNTEQFASFLDILPEYYKYSKIYGYRTKTEESYDCEIAYVNYRLKNYQKAIESYKICAQELKAKKEFLEQSSMINNIGLSFSKKQQTDSAAYYFKKSIEAISFYANFSKDADKKYASHFKNVVISNLRELNKDISVEKSLIFYFDELKSGKKFKEKNIISSAYLKIAENYFKSQKFVLTDVYLDSTFLILENYTNNTTRIQALNLKAKSLLAQDKFNASQVAFIKHQDFTDSLEVLKTKKEFMLGVVKHETDVRTKELEKSRLENEKEQKIINYQYIFLGTLILFLIGVLYFFFRLRTKNKVIKNQQQIVTAQLQEKEVLLKEIHHRVKNNLQVISGLLLIQSKKKKTNFDEIRIQSQQQIKAMSLVHEMLYQRENVSQIGMQEYMAKLAESIIGVQNNNSISTTIIADAIYLHIDYANPIGLMLTELITNSIKHGFTNTIDAKIKIKITKKDNTYQFIYADNGIGMDLSNLNKKDKSKFGSRLIKALSSEINADLVISSHNGISYTFTFKNKKK